jgi:hypothetical protein
MGWAMRPHLSPAFVSWAADMVGFPPLALTMSSLSQRVRPGLTMSSTPALPAAMATTWSRSRA